jgi:hypothetical protein
LDVLSGDSQFWLTRILLRIALGNLFVLERVKNRFWQDGTSMVNPNEPRWIRASLLGSTIKLDRFKLAEKLFFQTSRHMV